MTLIRIREAAGLPGGANAILSFDGGDEFHITVSDPFSEKEERRLAWYFEEHVRFPFTDQVTAREIAATIPRYGEALFAQVFADKGAYFRYCKALEAGVETLALEIAGSPAFHALHWEALKDPDRPKPLALEAPVVRRNLVPRHVDAKVRESPAINVLVVTARPGGKRDVGYRTISRPLVELLRQAGVPVRVDILRPGTYRALAEHLESVRDGRGSGFYHVVHFDAHGGLLSYEDLERTYEANQVLFGSRYGRGDVKPYQGLRGFLFLEGEQEGHADPVEAVELADLLVGQQVPVCILNACQSGKQVGDRETSLGSRLMAAGMQTVLAMGYSVTVSAAEVLMETLYRELFRGRDLPAAIRRGRLELWNRKERRAYYNQRIELEDWLLPVVYQNRAVRFAVREFKPEEAKDWYEAQARAYRPPVTEYGFVGRDLDVLNVERRLLRQGNELLIRGLGGAGKTTLLHHLAAWWQATGWVRRAWYFGYDERAWTAEQIVDAVARDLLGEAVYYGSFLPLGPAAKRARLAAELRGERHLLVLDNLESITGENLAVRNMLPGEERERLRAWLADLKGGRTVVLLGSRGGEGWLAPGTFGENVYELPGLDPEAASALAEEVLARHGAERYREDPAFGRLLGLLDGYPLPIQVVLANLGRQTPEEVLDAMAAGDEAVDMGGGDKTRSILRCIDYSHSALSPEDQGLLACLAPFTGVVFEPYLERYTEQLRQQPALAGLPFERWGEVLQAAADWGLLGRHPEQPAYLRLQPVLPYFLRSRLAWEGQAEARAAVEAAFRAHYDRFGSEIAGLLTSKEARERQVGQVLARLEYENLATALDLALAARAPFWGSYEALFRYLDGQQAHGQAIGLCRAVLAARDGYPAERLAGEVGVDFYLVFERLAVCQLQLKHYPEAQTAYQQELEQIAGLTAIAEDTRGRYSATIYHQLGMVAEEQRQWAQAEGYYRQALEIDREFNDRYSQASTYHQLGIVAQEQRQWAQAEGYYRQALEIYREFNDRYEQAGTHHQLGMVAQEQRQWAQAEGYYRQALELKVEFNDRYSQASTYHQLGRVAEAQRQWAQAEGYYRQALEIDREFNDRYEQAGTYHQLGMVAQEQRQWAQAEGYYRQALELKVEFNDRYSQASTYHGLGIVAQEQRQWAQAEGYYRQALEIFVEFNDRYAQALTYHQLGMVAQEQRQWAQAEEHFLRALETYVDYEDEHNLGIVLGSLARLHRAGGGQGLAEAVAKVLGISSNDAEALLARAAGG